MAKDKKSFVLYADLIKNIEHLTNEEKGILFNHLLEYVNDMNPVLTDRLILTAWKPIENQLKRDLKKFEKVREKRVEAGKKSAELRANKKEQVSTNSTSVKSVQHTSTNSTVNDNVNVNVNVNDNVNIDINKKHIFNSWIKYRQEIKKPIKSKSTIDSLIKKFNETDLHKCEWVVNNSIENNYQGLFWDNYKERTKQTNGIPKGYYRNSFTGQLVKMN